MKLVLLRDLDFICILISESLTLTFQSNMMRIWAHINYTLLLQNERLKPTEIYTLSHHCLSITPTQVYTKSTFILYPFSKMYKKWGMFHFFNKR